MAEMKDHSATDALNTARFPENQQPSTVNNGMRATEGLLARWKKDIDGSVSSAGTNTITLAAGSALTAYAAGDFFVFKAGGTNTGAATINIDSVGAKTIQKNLVALVAGDIQQNDIVAIYYDGTQFQMISPARTPVLTAGGIAGASVAIATASTRGSVEFATDAETITGSSTSLALTPANLQAMTGSATRDGILELATTAETVTGTDTARAVTPAGLHGALAGLTDTTITAADTVIFADATDSNALKEDTVQGILDLAGGGGKVLQYVQTQVTANATTTGTFPHDDTIPQISEGGEFITLAITPTASDSTLVIEVTAHIVATSSNRIAISAVFVDTTANALSGGCWKSFCPTVEDWVPHTIRIALSAASTSARTYRFRAGANLGGCEMNSDDAGTDFGGNIASYMSITEYAA